MGIQRTQDDSWTKEMARHEQRPVLVSGTYVEPIPFAQGGRGGAPFAEFPKAMYRAELAVGGPRISGMMSVADEGTERLAHGQGWRASQEDAIALAHANHREAARAAAERAATERWMSEAARAEAAAVDEATVEHVASIPVAPIRKAGSGKS